MDDYFELCGQVFEWDRSKARKNKMEHGVAFTDGATAFMDSTAVQFSDEEHSEDELREFLIGRAVDGRPSTGEFYRASTKPPRDQCASGQRL
jgi:uncharacterized DUF497 family protein